MNEMLQARDNYIKIMRDELLGPGSEISIPDRDHELISSSPHMRYYIGVLFPQNNQMNADNDDSSRVEHQETDEEPAIDEEKDNDTETTEEKSDPTIHGDEENLDEEIGLAAQNMPSSFGMTFFVEGNAERLTCDVSFGTYRNAKASDCMVPIFPKNPESFRVHPQLDAYVYYEKETGCLKLKGPLMIREVSKIREKDFLGSDEDGIINALYKLCTQLKTGYVRIPHNTEVVINFKDADYIDNNQEIDGTKVKLTALRRKLSDNVYSVTVMMINNEEGHANGKTCVFQPEIKIGTAKNNFVFKEYSGVSDFSILDLEEQSLELQYRNKRVYATGLGTSVNWDISGDGAGVLYNDFFPMVEVPNMSFALPAHSAVADCALSMKYLSDLTKAEKGQKLQHIRSLVDAYAQWINKQECKVLEIDEKYDRKYHEIAQSNLEGCRKSVNRMYAGIETLKADSQAWKSFELANRAMFMQRVHLKIQEMTSDVDRFPDDDELNDLIEDVDYNTIDQKVSDPYSWRPFQLAFLLMSIDSISKDDALDRSIVDLIWFPTGGGKTEAYLGLTAFTIFYRRLSHMKLSGGTAVIMRYTLRLLAAQQFTRASTLICACEYIRRDAIAKRSKYGKYDLGKEEITIGLWIGNDHTPNKNATAREHLKYLLDAKPVNLREVKDKHNKFQVLKCPWCGTKLVKERDGNKLKGAFGYRMRNNSHFELFCPQEGCFFNEVGKLPVQIVDDELYDNPPTLLFGTVDKFAMLPWKQEIGAFFGVNTPNRAPELIIQDELHLISGPLGTMVGLYESAIDILCKQKGVPTKIVASTATIRRAKEQCSALYDREVAQFPHPALDAEDSFFAREAVIDYGINSFGRKYIGLMPSGKTKVMMEVRTIATLMQRIHMMDLPEEIKDKLWTLTVYFNSLKDLGKCTTLVEDDIKDFMRIIAKRCGSFKDRRMVLRADELTSRVSTTELNETLDKLEKLTYSKDNIDNKRYASNILLATNMISVGIDVARLNVMVLVGQPKLTSEYIQASSRIGRKYPGVAFTLYDGSKSRDRSHYEQFKAYHESFYEHVEPTGATPFSKPARDRALHAVLIGLMRYMEPNLSEEKDAINFSCDRYRERIDEIKDAIIKRNQSITKRLNPEMNDDTDEIEKEIEICYEQWEHLAERYDPDHFQYGEKYMTKLPEEDFGRLLKAYNTAPYDDAFDTMTSMRNVDSTVPGKVLIWE